MHDVPLRKVLHTRPVQSSCERAASSIIAEPFERSVTRSIAPVPEVVRAGTLAAPGRIQRTASHLPAVVSSLSAEAAHYSSLNENIRNEGFLLVFWTPYHCAAWAAWDLGSPHCNAGSRSPCCFYVSV
jgi:hypothetical protein